MLLIISVLLLTTATSTYAYVVSGYVFDSNGNPLANVTVGLEDNINTIRSAVYTDNNGYFEFNNIPQGFYIIYVNDIEPIFWQYIGAGIGDTTPLLEVNSNIQINFELLEIYLGFTINNTEYQNGDIIEVNITLENYDIYDLINWEIGAALFFENETHQVWIDEVYDFFNISSGETKTFLAYLQIPLNNTYNNLYISSWIWAYGIEFESSKGLLVGELWKVDLLRIFIGNKTKFNLTLSKGWNLISIPLFLQNGILPAPLKSIEGNYSHGFTYIDGKWYSYYANDTPSFDKYIDPIMGFWINMINDDVLVVEGYEWQDPIIEFILGWNLIGYPYLEEKNISELFENVSVYSYNGTWSTYIPNRTYNSLKTLKPGYGYWVKK